MRKILPCLVTILCAACGSGEKGGTGGTGGTGGAGTTSSTGAGASSGTAIPDPGTTDQVDNDFTEVSPDNTPSLATPLGVAAQGGVNVWVNGNEIGGSGDEANYFVFKNGDAAGLFTFDVCFGAPITAMTATLWTVVDSEQQTPPVGTWTSSAGCVTDTTPPMLEASAVYLFGLTATGGAGMYGA